MLRSVRIEQRMAALPQWTLVMLAGSASFSTYFCMYAFRKPFTAGQFAEGGAVAVPGFDRTLQLKTLLVISQIIGYAISKYSGIKVCSEVRRSGRAWLLVGLIAWAECALLLFALLPLRWGWAAMLLNGLPLGMVWGLVVLYLEGRRTSELLLATLSCSFILASGVVKDIGKWLLASGVPEQWMPAATGAMFLLPFIALVWLMDHLPDPVAQDVVERSMRQPMRGRERWNFITQLFPSMLPLLVVYFVLTAFRDFRDNYGVEMFEQLGYTQAPAIFSRSELPVALGVLIVLAALNLVRGNRAGLLAAHGIMIFGSALLAGATIALDAGIISGLTWMILLGLGTYLAYVPFGSVLFDRMMAATRLSGTAVFAIYLADALGYTGSVAVQIYKDLFAAGESRLDFFKQLTMSMSGLNVLGFGLSATYLWMRSRVPATGTSKTTAETAA